MGPLNKYLWKYRKLFLLGILFVVISNIFHVYAPRLIRYAFDLVKEVLDIYQVTEGFETRNDISRIFGTAVMGLGILYIILALLRGLFMFFMRQTIIVMSRHIEYDLKNEIYWQYQKLSLSFYKRNSTGDLMNRISEDVSRVRMYLGPAIMYTINLVVLFVLVITSMISVNPVLTVYVLLPLPVLAFAIYKVSSIMNRKSDRVQAQLSTLSTMAQEAYSGIRVIKAYLQNKTFGDRFQAEAENYKEKSMSLVKTNALFFPIMMLLIGLSTLFTIYVGGRQAIAGEITMGNIAEFVIYVNMLTWPVASVGWVTSLVQRAAASQHRINEFLREKPEIVDPETKQDDLEGSIEFRNVSFVYPDSGIKAIDDVSFHVKPGEVIAILGRTGSGKSTIAQLITRLFDVTKGEILIDGRNIKESNLSLIRSRTGYVPQEVFLFSDSIANNIAFGEKVDNEDRTAIEQAARDAAIYANIKEFPKGFDTLVGERGITLSGGQKQRVSIARAIIKKPAILIFDDCLSAVDTETENEILGNLRKIMKGRTTLIISHRVSSVVNADKIIVLDNGRIIEKGNHQELLRKNGVYAELYQKQLLEGVKENTNDENI